MVYFKKAEFWHRTGSEPSGSVRIFGHDAFPPSANAPTKAVSSVKTACITARAVTEIRKLVMET